MDSKSSSPQVRIRLRMEQLEDRISPSIVLVNPAGNTPQGLGANNGQAIVAVNPA